MGILAVRQGGNLNHRKWQLWRMNRRPFVNNFAARQSSQLTRSIAGRKASGSECGASCWRQLTEICREGRGIVRRFTAPYMPAVLPAGLRDRLGAPVALRAMFGEYLLLLTMLAALPRTVMSVLLVSGTLTTTVVLSACGADVSGAAATAADLKARELQQATQQEAQVRQRLDSAMQAAEAAASATVPRP